MHVKQRNINQTRIRAIYDKITFSAFDQSHEVVSIIAYIVDGISLDTIGYQQAECQRNCQQAQSHLGSAHVL